MALYTKGKGGRVQGKLKTKLYLPVKEKSKISDIRSRYEGEQVRRQIKAVMKPYKPARYQWETERKWKCGTGNVEEEVRHVTRELEVSRRAI